MIYPSDSKLEWAKTPSGLIIPRDCQPPSRPKAFDFFAGCGGFSCGLHQAGFHVIGALEMDYSAAHTYTVNLGNYPMQFHFDTDERRDGFEAYMKKCFNKVVGKKIISAGKNADFPLAGSGWISHHKDCDCYEGHHKGVDYDGKLNPYFQETKFNARPLHAHGCEHFWIADIRNLTGKQILDSLSLEVGELDLVVGGPPCQGFSRAGKQDETDPRNNLVFEFGRMIVEMNPKTIIMENVPDIVNMETEEGINIVEGFCKILADGEYAPFESLRRSLFGRKGAKAVLRAEQKQKVKRKSVAAQKSKPIEKVNATTTQASLF